MWDWGIDWGVVAYLIFVVWYDYYFIYMLRGGVNIKVVEGVNGYQAAATMFTAGFVVFHPLASMMMNTVSQTTANGVYDFIYWFFDTFSIIGVVHLINKL